MVDVVSSLKLLFDRPSEPLITPKGDKGAIFQLNEELLPPDYAGNGMQVMNRFGRDDRRLIPLEPLNQVPQFRLASKLPHDENFSLFLPRHQEMATEVIDVLMGLPEGQLEQFLATCVFARANLNPQLFMYCFSVALTHRKDTRNVPIQNFAETFPFKFLDSQVFTQAREYAAVIPEDVPRPPIIIPRDFSATDLDIEHRLAYWREDIGINLHHWHWHLVYPFTSSDRSIVAKDRRGELFFYMHQQIVARYNCERLCNSLMRVKKFSNWREPIPEGYFPKLDNLTTSRGWPPRQGNMVWKNLNRPADGLDVTIEDMERWRKNIEEAISTGVVILPNETTKPLDIDTLGNMVEASMLTPNFQLYGNLHNYGHAFTAYMHDPENRYLEKHSVMADEATTMRDPYFYRWHGWIDDTFQKHKESPHVPRYTPTELGNPGVQVTSASIETDGAATNTLNTFWMISDVDLSRGLDFSNRGPVRVRFTHLNHRPFRYVINVNNTGTARRTTVRIFIAPKFDERKLPWLFSDQRKMFIEMDRFVIQLNTGQNKIIRASTDSSVTIPFEQTFRDLSAQGDNPSDPTLAAFNFCGCGWPQHMLVPKGTETGAAYQLFVMLSNYDLDKIEQPADKVLTCKEASSFCGLKDKKYPDRRAMGFPFDRPSNTSTFEQFMMPNMALTDITINLTNTTESNPRNPKQ